VLYMTQGQRPGGTRRCTRAVARKTSRWAKGEFVAGVLRGNFARVRPSRVMLALAIVLPITLAGLWAAQSLRSSVGSNYGGILDFKDGFGSNFDSAPPT
jgi:hypothetical protein